MSYSGDVTPAQAWESLEKDADATLVDVRTNAEWNYVGLPDVSGLDKRVVCVEWQSFPSGEVNQNFLQELADAGVDQQAPVYFLCRSGVRSIAAAEAATAAGWGQSFNVLEGFEGPHDENRHRTVGGWKGAGLPWVQG